MKIRGHRIELGEVEAALAAHPDVREAVAVVLGDDPLHRRLVGFVTGAGESEPEALGRHVAGRLPEYMVPAQVQRLEQIPLGANGKVDRRALQALAAARPAAAEDPADQAPRSDPERRLAGLWAEVLGLAEVGRSQDFFQLGGDSLLAAKLVGRMREQIPEAAGLFFDSLIRQMLPSPTVAALAAHLAAQQREVAEPAPRPARAPLVALHAGEGPACVLVHDGSGGLEPYHALIAALPGPLVGLVVDDPRPYLALDPAALIERRASSYLRLLRAHGHRRVLLVGCGLAAPFAIETARQVAEDGGEVLGVTLLSPYPVPPAPDAETIARLFAGENGPQEPDGADADDPADRREIFRRSALAAATYRPSPYLGDLTIVRPADDPVLPMRGSEAARHWEDLRFGELRLIDLPGDHARCLRDGVDAVAGAIQESIARRPG